MKTFLIHDWLYTVGGAERVLEAILRCVNIERIFTLMDFLPSEKRGFLKEIPIATSFLQKMPLASSKRRNYLPLMPLAIESLDLSQADLLISSSAAIAKGIKTLSQQMHICYCHSPARFIWDLSASYLDSESKSSMRKFLVNLVFHYLRIWDSSTSNRVDHFVANSLNTARRIWRFYRRESTVIYPPVNIENLQLVQDKDNFYLTVSRLVPYKKIDLIVEAFSLTGQKLVVVGEGPELSRLKRGAVRNIEILGYQPDDVVKDLLQRARAFIFAAHEDFGIVPVEAQACGTPVIAFGQGGSIESIKGIYPGSEPSDETTGVFFQRQEVLSLMEAINWFERCAEKINPDTCRRHAEGFSQQRFLAEFSSFVKTKWTEFDAQRQFSATF